MTYSDCGQLLDPLCIGCLFSYQTRLAIKDCKKCQSMIEQEEIKKHQQNKEKLQKIIMEEYNVRPSTAYALTMMVERFSEIANAEYEYGKDDVPPISINGYALSDEEVMRIVKEVEDELLKIRKKLGYVE